jgi:hypothetical protein
MVEYAKNVNLWFVIARTFQLHSKFSQEKHVYFTDRQHNEMTVISQKNNGKADRRTTFFIM